MTTTIKSAKGPMHQDIYPIIARSKDELEKCYKQFEEFVKEKGGVDVYRILEGADKSLAGLSDGDIIIVPLGNKMDTKSGEITLVASYSGELRDVLPHFRFKTKRKWNKEHLPYPPAPKQHLDKYGEQETVRNRPDKAPPSESVYSHSSDPKVKDIYTCDLDYYTAQVFHYMPEFRKRKKAPSPDDELLIIKVKARGKLAKLLDVSDDDYVYKKVFSCVEIAEVAYDLDQDTEFSASDGDVLRIHDALVTFLDDGGDLEDKGTDKWHLYRNCLSMMKSYVELEFLADLELLASKKNDKKCEMTKMCRDEYDKRELSLIDDLETDRDIITDFLVKVDKNDEEG